jgi:NAD(P)-dependent dehydrogenase (short-subunit alcohol dehydrogenase family)
MLNKLKQGWTKMSVFGDLHALSEDEWDKVSLLKSIRIGLTVCSVGPSTSKVKWQSFERHFQHSTQTQMVKAPTFKTFLIIRVGGSFILTSSIAGASTGGSSMPYSITKAAQNHLMRCLAQTQGPKVRVNAVLPGLLLTEWVSVVALI